MSRLALGLEGVLDGGGQGGDGKPAVVGPDDLAGRGDQGQPGLVLHVEAVSDAAGGVEGDRVAERGAEAAQVGADGLGRGQIGSSSPVRTSTGHRTAPVTLQGSKPLAR